MNLLEQTVQNIYTDNISTGPPLNLVEQTVQYIYTDNISTGPTLNLVEQTVQYINRQYKYRTYFEVSVFLEVSGFLSSVHLAIVLSVSQSYKISKMNLKNVMHVNMHFPCKLFQRA